MSQLPDDPDHVEVGGQAGRAHCVELVELGVGGAADEQIEPVAEVHADGLVLTHLGLECMQDIRGALARIEVACSQ